MLGDGKNIISEDEYQIYKEADAQIEQLRFIKYNYDETQGELANRQYVGILSD